MKRIKLKDKLPEEGQNIFCYVPIGISKTSREISYKKEVGIRFGTIFCTENEDYTEEENYCDIEWLDETEKEIDITEQLKQLILSTSLPEVQKLKLYEGRILYWSSHYSTKEEFDEMFNITCKREGVIKNILEKDITDTDRLDWLENNKVLKQEYSDNLWLHEQYLGNLTLREFIDKQIQNEK